MPLLSPVRIFRSETERVKEKGRERERKERSESDEKLARE